MAKVNLSDAQLKAKRLEILKQIDITSPLCKCDNHTRKQSCRHCKKLAILGDELIKLTRPRKRLLENGMARSTPIKNKPIKRFPIYFTVEDYLNAKDEGLSDEAFAKQVNISRSKFYDWKKVNIDEINRLKIS